MLAVTSFFQLSRRAAALASALALAGCGLLPTAKEVVAALERSGLGTMALSEAAELLFTEVDEGLADLNDEDALGAVKAEMGMEGFDPSGGAVAAAAPSPQRDGGSGSWSVETGLGGRPLSADIVVELESGPWSQIHHELTWTWSSGLDDSGDLNDTAPVDRGGPHGWRRIDAHSEMTWRTRGGAGVTSVTRAMRRDHTDPAISAFQTAVTAIAPDHEKVPWRRMEMHGEFGLEATGSGHFSRRLEFRDDGLDVQEWSVALTDGTLTIAYEHQGPDGLTATGQGAWEIGDTTRCPLDDVGRFELTRQFSAQGTESTRPVEERVQRRQDGRVTVIEGELELADGRTLSRAVTWTVEAPANCSDRPTERRISFTGVGYGGAQRSGQIIRAAGRWERTARVERQDGRVVETSVVRSGGATVVTVRQLRADGGLASLLELNVAPGGRAQGTLTQYDEAGEVISVTEVERELDGRYRLRRSEGEELRWRQGQR